MSDYQPTHASTSMIEVVEPDPKKPWKAVYSAASTFVIGFVIYWIADKGKFTSDDVKAAIFAGLVSSGLVGGGTFGIPNPLRRRKKVSRS